MDASGRDPVIVIPGAGHARSFEARRHSSEHRWLAHLCPRSKASNWACCCHCTSRTFRYTDPNRSESTPHSGALDQWPPRDRCAEPGDESMTRLALSGAAILSMAAGAAAQVVDGT